MCAQWSESLNSARRYAFQLDLAEISVSHAQYSNISTNKQPITEITLSFTCQIFN